MAVRPTVGGCEHCCLAGGFDTRRTRELVRRGSTSIGVGGSTSIGVGG